MNEVCILIRKTQTVVVYDKVERKLSLCMSVYDNIRRQRAEIGGHGPEVSFSPALHSLEFQVGGGSFVLLPFNCRGDVRRAALQQQQLTS